MTIPFQLPADSYEVTIDLPFPPSSNRIYRVGKGGRVYRDRLYLIWIKNCDAMWATGVNKSTTDRFNDWFTIDIALHGRAGCDGDNRIKPVLDYLQRIEII